MNKLVWKTIKDPHDAPSSPGVYAYWQNRQILYIGKAISLRARLLSHAQNAKLDAKERAIVQGATHIKYTLVDSDFFALLLESKLIKQYQPPYNLIAKDDSSYLYIVIDTKDEFPKPRLVRGRDLSTMNHVPRTTYKSFGPFPSTAVAEEILKSIRRLVPFCTQNGVGKRACFYSHVGLCNPCPANILKLPAKSQLKAKAEYRSHIFQLIHILEGKTAPRY